jgi:hypothetical protein
MSFLPPTEGTIASQPFGNTIAAGVHGAYRTGSIAGSPSAPLPGGVESAEGSALAELSSLISALGSLSAQAQSLPLSPPTLPGLPQNQAYQPQATDYTQFSDDSN